MTVQSFFLDAQLSNPFCCSFDDSSSSKKKSFSFLTIILCYARATDSVTGTSAYEALSEPPSLPPLHHIPRPGQTQVCHLSYAEISGVVLTFAQLTESSGIRIALLPYCCRPNEGRTFSPIFKVVWAKLVLLVCSFPMLLPDAFYLTQCPFATIMSFC